MSRLPLADAVKMQISAVDISAARMPTSIRPLRPTGNVSNTNLDRILLLFSRSGYRRAAVIPSHTAPTARGNRNIAAQSVPCRATRSFFAANILVKLSIPTKKLMGIDTPSASIVETPQPVGLKWLAGSCVVSASQVPPLEMATGMPTMTTPTNSNTSCTQSV